MYRTLFALPLLILLLAGCGLARAPLSGVRLEPHSTISPNADGVDDLTRLHYTVGVPSAVTVALVDDAGNRRIWAERQPRVPGAYEAWFSGVVEGAVLPDGDYRFQITAEPENGAAASVAEIPISIRDADTEPLRIEGLSVTPRLITPNKDGVNDEAVITYSLSKDLTERGRIAVYLLDAAGNRHAVPDDLIYRPTAAGSHLHRYSAGVALGAVPPPDGTYTVVVEAQDAVGATATATGMLELAMGGIPLAQITRHTVAFSTEVLTVGDTLYFTTTVTNVGLVPVRTHGPEPGTIYDSTTNYNSFDEPISDGAWRLGLDFEGNRVLNGQRYPYRWQLGRASELTEIEGERYLMPNQSVLLTGGLRLLELPPRTAPGFWIGLIHENVRFAEDFVGTSYITIETATEQPSTTGSEP